MIENVESKKSLHSTPLENSIESFPPTLIAIIPCKCVSLWAIALMKISLVIEPLGVILILL